MIVRGIRGVCSRYVLISFLDRLMLKPKPDAPQPSPAPPISRSATAEPRLRTSSVHRSAGAAAARHQPQRPLSSARPARWSTTAGAAPPSCRRCARGDAGEGQDHHHAQRLARHLLRPLDQPLSRLRARLHLLLRPADARLSWASRRGSISRPSSSPSRTRPSCSSASWPRRATSRARSRSAPTPTPTSRSSASTGITRGVLEVLDADFGHPVGIVTKSALVTRDIDILGAHGRARARQGRALGDHARPRARAHDGAARRDAAEAARGASRL